MIELTEWIVLLDKGMGRSPYGTVKTTKNANKKIAEAKAWKKFIKDGVLPIKIEVIKKEDFYK